MHLDDRDGPIQLVQLDLDPTRHIDDEPEYLSGSGFHVKLLLGHRVHVELVSGIAGDRHGDRLADPCRQLGVGRRDGSVRDRDVEGLGRVNVMMSVS